MKSNMTETGPERFRRGLTLCQTCLLDEVTTDATGYCVDCMEGLCNSCIKYHRRSKASRKHDVLTIADDNSKFQVFQCLNEIFRCQKHPDLEVEKYCEEHKRYVCSVCISTTHQSCKVTDKVCNKHSDFSRVEKLSDNIEQEVARLRQKRKANECRIKDTCESIACRRKFLVESLRRQVDGLDKKLEFETESLLQSEVNNISTDLKHCDEIEERQKALMNIRTSLKEAGLTEKEHVLGQEMENMLRAMKEDILKRQFSKIEFVEATNDLVSLGTVKKVTFSEVELSSACADSIESNEITAAESLVSNATNVQTANKKETEQQKQIVPLSKSNCTFFRKVSLGKEKVTTDVTAIVLLQNDLLVVADKANKMLRVFTSIGTPACTIVCDHSPLSMCRIPGQDIVVTFSEANLIKRYHINANSSKHTGQFVSEKKCRDITSCNDNVALLVHGDNQYEIEIRRVSNGHILRHIRTLRGIVQSVKQPSCFMYLQTEAVFIVGEDDTVHCFNGEGDELWFYKQYQGENEMKTITGFAADNEDNVYVCCQGSENVHQVSANNYRQYREILSNMTDIRAIAFDKSKRRLYVGTAGCDEISCYRFVY